MLTGSTNAGVVVTSDSNVRLVLNDATIGNTNGAAIVTESAEYLLIQTQTGTTNVSVTRPRAAILTSTGRFMRRTT